ncbi:MAG: LemA family protein, partial [Verrucomicrobiota bacterium]
ITLLPAAITVLVVLALEAAGARFQEALVGLEKRGSLVGKHESETLEAVIAARSTAVNAQQKAAAKPDDPQAMRDLMAAEGQLGGVLGRLFALSEAYPDLKANQNMMQLTEELTSTENKISFARQAFNDAVMVYNTAREVFPAVVFAGMFGFLPAELFEIESPEEKEAPKVSF